MSKLQLGVVPCTAPVQIAVLPPHSLLLCCHCVPHHSTCPLLVSTTTPPPCFRGRKRAALLYVATYSLSCLTKHSSDYWVLMLGRLLGGIATSLLFSAFESWAVAAHNAAGFEESLLSDLFTKAVFLGNGVMAIASGLLGNVLVEDLSLGPVAPFDAAIVVLLLGGVAIQLTWAENYGSKGTIMTEMLGGQFGQAIHTIRTGVCVCVCLWGGWRLAVGLGVFLGWWRRESAQESVNVQVGACQQGLLGGPQDMHIAHFSADSIPKPHSSSMLCRAVLCCLRVGCACFFSHHLRRPRCVARCQPGTV